MYKIRKSEDWINYQFSWTTVFFLGCIVTIWLTAVIGIILSSLWILESESESGWETETDVGVWIILIAHLIVMSILWFFVIKMSKIYFSKNLKKNWKWTIENVKITSIEEINWWNFKGIQARWDSFKWYCLEAEHWHVIYCSDGIKKSDVQEVLLNPDFSKLYKSYWYEYDQKETHKKEVLHEMDKDIINLQHKIDCSWFFNAFSAKKGLAALQHKRELVEAWYKPSYLVVNWHKISTWDSVDVYIDPNNEKIYWMDIDFLFDK